MIKFITILIGLFTLLGIGRAWIAGFVLFFSGIDNWIPENVATIVGIIIIVCLLLFFIIHSIKLMMFFESARKNQIIITCIDPVIRILSILILRNANFAKAPEAFSSISRVVVGLIIITSIDAFMFYYLRRQKVRDAFKLAEDDREYKFRMKLMKK